MKKYPEVLLSTIVRYFPITMKVLKSLVCDEQREREREKKFE
jgi:hypothetical protein